MFICFIVPIHFLVWARRLQRRNKRSPLTLKLLRGPGEKLRQELIELHWDLSAYFALLFAFPLLTLSIHLSQSHFADTPETPFRWFLTGVMMTCGVGFIIFKIWRLGQLRYDLQNGLEAEIAMGQELDQLMRAGAVVFHDVPAEGFNIDHVVVTGGGVYAVETKARMKPDRGGGKRDATVHFNGEGLSFPSWRDAETLEQARRQAKWLSKWISSAVGEQISVKPVVALPGWFVERAGRGDVIVISGREAPSLLKGWQSTAFSAQQIARIAHQLEQRCRDVEPTQYGRQQKFGRASRQST
jgi:hypothetical protein